MLHGLASHPRYYTHASCRREETEVVVHELSQQPAALSGADDAHLWRRTAFELVPSPFEEAWRQCDDWHVTSGACASHGDKEVRWPVLRPPCCASGHCMRRLAAVNLDARAPRASSVTCRLHPTRARTPPQGPCHPARDSLPCHPACRPAC